MPFSVRDAAAAMIATARPVGTETIALVDALDRVLGADVSSGIALPPWDNASMDGYAVRAADVDGASADHPIVLDVLGTIAAGSSEVLAMRDGSAIRIMTGAPIPHGADTVIRVEDTDAGTEQVSIRNARDARDARRNIRARGEDIVAGDVVLARGAEIGPAQLGVLASVGAREVTVFRRPRVALLATGDEVVSVDDFDQVIAGRRIVSSNSYSIRAALMRMGVEVIDLGIARDEPDRLRTLIDQANEQCDLIITTGGVSAGAFDHTREVVRSLGGEIVVDRVRMRPGAPLAFGSLGTTVWLGLPGNPVSALVTFELFGQGVVRRLSGANSYFPLPIPVVAGETITINGALTHFLRATVTSVNEGGESQLVAHLTGGQGSGILTSMARGQALVVVSASRPRIDVGETVPAILLGGHPLRTTTFDVE